MSSFLLQADANDTYKIFGADVDRPDAYKLLLANIAGTILWGGLAFALLGESFPRSVYGIGRRYRPPPCP